MSTLSEIYGHCPVCGMQGTTAGFVCGHNPFTSPNPGSDSAPIQYSFADSRDAEIAKLREALVEASRLATMVANIIGQVDNWCPTTALCCVLNLNGIIKAAAQALAEPEGKL